MGRRGMNETRNAKTKPGTAKPRLPGRRLRLRGESSRRASSRDRRVAGHKTLSSVQEHSEDFDDDSELTDLLERIGQLHLDARGLRDTPHHAAPHIVDVEVFDIIRREHLLGRLDRTEAR